MNCIPVIQRIICPVDFSDNAAFVLNSAVEVAARLEAELHFIFVVQDFIDYSGLMEPQLIMPSFDEEMRTMAEERLADLVAENKDLIDAKGVKKVGHKVLAGDVAEEIITYAREWPANLIVIGTHGYKGLDRLLFGSVATKVVQSAPCPVLSVNPHTCSRAD
ncbi:MAG: universal stress protein [Thermodesulfobacteriota bacterium]